MRLCVLVSEPAALRVVPLSPPPLSRWLVAVVGVGVRPVVPATSLCCVSPNTDFSV